MSGEKVVTALADWLDVEADGSWNAHAEAAVRIADLILGGAQ